MGLTCSDTDMVTNCVATCNLCGHRRAQITMRCKDFEEKVETVNTACCDYEGCSGVPTTCDAKCAIVYNDFFDQCASKLEDNIQPSEIQAYRNLHATCAGLPVEPLMRALIACQVPSPPLPPTRTHLSPHLSLKDKSHFVFAGESAAATALYSQCFRRRLLAAATALSTQ